MRELRRVLEKRRSDLYHLLTHSKDSLSPERQHQLFGALNELDLILRTIDHKLQEEDVPVIRLNRPVEPSNRLLKTKR